MSRSNPHENSQPNPATRWLEWNSEQGSVRYYDKALKQNVDVGADFTFLLLDQLGAIRGWHDESSSGIYSNEVKDTRESVLVVKAFKGGVIAEGRYQDIKDKVARAGGRYTASCYIAFKNDDGALVIGNLALRGAALRAWMDFTQAHRAELLTKAVRIDGFQKGKKGRVTYRMPSFTVADVSEETQAAAVALDLELQTFLAHYLKRPLTRRSEPAVQSPGDIELPDDTDDVEPVTADDIPF